MKKIGAFLVALFVLGATMAVAQPVPGKKFELSTAFSFSSFKSSGSTSSDSFLSIPLRFGYFVWKGLELEPELVLAKFSHSDAAFNLSGNLVYNFRTSGGLVPFVLGGVGAGNGFSVGMLAEGGTGISALLFNGGAGVKYVLGGAGAIRFEYRFTYNRLSKGDLPAQKLNVHQFFIGVSLFF